MTKGTPLTKEQIQNYKNDCWNAIRHNLTLHEETELMNSKFNKIRIALGKEVVKLLFQSHTTIDYTGVRFEHSGKCSVKIKSSLPYSLDKTFRTRKDGTFNIKKIIEIVQQKIDEMNVAHKQIAKAQEFIDSLKLENVEVKVRLGHISGEPYYTVKTDDGRYNQRIEFDWDEDTQSFYIRSVVGMRVSKENLKKLISLL